jgi:hypothetical protein
MDSTFYSNYEGEYQIHLKDWLYWIDPMAKEVMYRIEVVSFPFTPKDEVPQVGDRTMVMPALESFGRVDEGVDCSGWAWERNVPGATNPRNLMRSVSGRMSTTNAGTNNVMSRPAALASTMFHAVSVAGCGPDSINRQWLPHAVLKHTLIVLDGDGTPLDSVSWVYDNTRGRMRNYPFAEWYEGQSQSWDVVFRPVLLHDPAGSGHPYDATGNGSWYVEDGSADSTANYFPPVAPGPGGQVFPVDPSTATYPDDAYLHPPPYAMLEAPLLNISGNGYAGYHPDVNGHQETFFAGDTAWDVPHIYVIDKPIDLRTINVAERIIYNPSEVLIEMAPAYTGDTLVFPSGYTFKTVHGVHPSVSAVLATDPDGLYPDPLIAPVPSTLGDSSSTYFVKSGNTLRIEPCVTIMDAYIVVEDGETLAWDSTAVNGNYHVAFQPGSINAFVPAANERPCPWNCYSSAFYEANNITISGLQTWSTTNLPGDGDSDGRLRIRGTLRIPQDQRLIIEPDVVLEFGPNAKVIVERGGQLNAEGAHFTNACEMMWQGMEVWGETDHAQYPFSGNTATGRMILEGGSTVENARYGVRVFKPGSEDHNGGVLWATDCAFYNNYMDIEIRPTRNLIGGVEHANVCKIEGCTFETNTFLLDPAYGDGEHRSAAAEHVRLVDVTNVNIKNNAFTTNVPGHVFPPHLRGTGIMSFNASVLIQGNTFNGLSQAAWAANFPGFRNVRVRNNVFANSVHSVILQGTYAAEVTRNSISVPRSAGWNYAQDDVERGCNLPVGVYLMGSTEYNVEDNDIVGSEADASNPAENFSYGIVASESMYSERDPPEPNIPDPVELDSVIDNRKSTASIFLNRISGFSVGLQMEGDNRGAFSTTHADSSGYGLVVGCNDLMNGSENWWLDMAVVGNYIDDVTTYTGRLRDQGECSDIELQAGNVFSNCWGSTFAPEHLYFDSRSDSVNFHYADDPNSLPSCENVPIIGVQACSWGLTRLCETTLDCDAPCLYERREQVRATIDEIDDLLDIATSEDEITELQHQRAFHRAQQRIIHSAEVRYYLENENMDSLLRVIESGEGASELREALYYFISKGEYAEADSMIDVIIATEGGTPSAHTELVMLQLSLLNVQQSMAHLSPTHKLLLDAMVAQDPLGASSAKALLALAFGQQFKRVPWALNDTLVGRALWQHLTPVRAIRLWPVPTHGVLNLESPFPLSTIEVVDAMGRVVMQWKAQPSGTSQLDVGLLSTGLYALRCTTISGMETKWFIKLDR